MNLLDKIIAVILLGVAVYYGIKWMKELITYKPCEQEEDESEK